jgi:deoxycytidine triphosphate deaminase
MEIPQFYCRPRRSVREQDLWIDPDPHSSGLLLSDRILFYCNTVGLIHPFDPQYVEPASYTLHAGREYIIATGSGQHEVRSLEDETKVIIPPNGLIYIRFYEEITLPYYMIARFNLRVTQVYRGLLLGTGPQVDPGFNGLLGCPIHNFTDADKTIRFFEPLATIDFEKTTPLAESMQLLADDFAQYRTGDRTITGKDGLPCKIFNRRVNASFASYLPPGESVRSSVQALYSDVARVKKGLKNIERAGAVAIAIALIGLLVASLGMLYPLYTNVKDDISSKYMDLKHDIVEITKSVSRLEAAAESRLATGDGIRKVELQRGKQPQTRRKE